MTATSYYCQPETNLGSATELMWNANCGFLPVEDTDKKIVGVVTDRDICVALGTRNRLPGDVTVGEIMSARIHSCDPDDDIHIALQTMKEGKAKRLPVIAKNGSLVGVVSTDDILLRAEPTGMGKPRTVQRRGRESYRVITQRKVAQRVAKARAAGADFRPTTGPRR